MRILLVLLALGMVTITPAFADQVIRVDFTDYEIAEVTDVRQFKNSPIVKTQGYTTTGDMFFAFESTKSDFIYVMLLDRDGQWHRGEIRDNTPAPQPKTSSGDIIPDETVQIHYLMEQYERVYNTTPYKFFVKTFDSSIYSGADFQQFQGKVSGATVQTIITDPNGVTKAELEGVVTNGMYEGSVIVPQNLWMRGWYTVDIVIEQNGQSYKDQLSFYVFGAPPPKGSAPTPEPTP